MLKPIPVDRVEIAGGLSIGGVRIARLFRIQESVRTIAEQSTDGSLDARMQAVGAAVRAKYGDEPGSYCYTREVFDDYVIVAKGDKLWRVDYTMADDGSVTLAGDLQQVRQVYQPITQEGAVLGPLGDDGKPFVVQEAAADGAAPALPDGRKWGVVIIEEGMSKNRNRYAGKVLTKAAGKYEGAPVFIDHVESAGPWGRSGTGKVGFIKGVQVAMIGGTQESAGKLALVGTLVVTKPGLRQEMVDAWTEGHELFGLSHSIQGDGAAGVDAGGPFYDVTRIEKVESVDLVVNPAAGGRLMRLVAGGGPAATLEGDGRMLTKLIEAIKASGNAAAIKALEALGNSPTEDGVLAIYQGLIPANPPAPTRTEATRTDPAPVVVEQPTRQGFTLTEADWVSARRDAVQGSLDSILAGVSLPDPVKANIRKHFEALITEATTTAALPTKAAIQAHVQNQVELFGQLAEQGLSTFGSRPRIEIVEDSRKKFEARLDDFFDTSKPAQSIRTLYVDMTGDTGFTGKVTREVQQRLTEAIGTATFDQVMGDSITRRMLAEYKLQVDLNNWRGVIADVVPLSDFRTQRRIRMGGYGNLPLVGQGAPYLQLTTPSDEEATYAPAKRGGTESVTLEAIQNDDIGIIRRIPQRLARSAAQTLHEFVWDFLANNSAVYDSVALAAVGHNNIVTTALSGSNLSSLRLKLKQQTDMTNGKRLGLKASHLIVPSELEELAWQYITADRALPDSSLAAQAAPAAPNPVRRQGLNLVVVDYWTDANNYWVTADPSQGPMMEVGFLNGREEPELFVQDLPNVGSMFTHDTITWKIRHIYGGAILDFRLFAAGIVP